MVIVQAEEAISPPATRAPLIEKGALTYSLSLFSMGKIKLSLKSKKKATAVGCLHEGSESSCMMRWLCHLKLGAARQSFLRLGSQIDSPENY